VAVGETEVPVAGKAVSEGTGVPVAVGRTPAGVGACSAEQPAIKMSGTAARKTGLGKGFFADWENRMNAILPGPPSSVSPRKTREESSPA
jgi:hypothetical protein